MVENNGSWKDRALGLPTGSVRAIIALAMISVAGYMIVFSVLVVPEWFQTVIAMIIGFYFGKKV